MESKIPKPSMIKKPYNITSLPGNARLPLSELLNNANPGSYLNRKRADSPEMSNIAKQDRGKLRRSRSATDLSRPNFHRSKFIPNLETITSAKTTLNSAHVNKILKSNTVKVEPKAVGIRRSLSTSDLTTMKQPVNFMCSTSVQSHIVKRQMPQNTSLPTKAAKFNSGTTATGSVFRNKPAPGTAKSITFTKPKIGLAKASSISSSASCDSAVSSGGPAKRVVKKIPSYDYKARFNDLKEKHQSLKERYENLQQRNMDLESFEQKYELCISELAYLKEQHEKLQADYSVASAENSNLTLKNASLSSCLSEIKTELHTLKKQYSIADEERVNLAELLRIVQEKSALLEERNAFLREDNDKKSELLFKANLERKDLHNAVMDLRGNIRVFCRVRPPLASELDRQECMWKYLDEQSLEISTVDGSSKRMEFSFDHVFHPRTMQVDIFENVAPLIQSALDGYNVCIFAYGQTGSGKTYTMDGVPEELGVIPRTVELIFNSIEDYKRLGWEYELRVTFLEIYNEILYDLLDSSGTTKDLEIRMASAKSKTEVYVSNIIEETVTSQSQLRQLMSIAKSNRATAATVVNERSSRSHAVTKIQLLGSHQQKGELSVGSINLVDLAGSESPKTSTRMDETKNINRSLSELSNVILALVQKHEHIPYRNSKLTHLLMPSLGGNSKTLMFVNVSPFQDCYNETIKSLRFASQVNSCKLQKVRKNKILNNSGVF